MLDDSEVQNILEARKQAARSYAESELLAVRETARDYYEGKPFGNEVEGRSQFILTDVRDKIEALMPALMKVFTSGEKIFEFQPVGPEDIEWAKQATIGVNDIFMKRNRGFMVLETAFKDGLLEKNGITKTWVEKKDLIKTEKRTGLLPDDYAELSLDPKVEILEEEARETEILDEQITVYDVKFTRNYGEKCDIRVGNVVPENFLIDPAATYIAEADYVAEMCPMTVSELIDLEVDPDVASELPAKDVNNKSAITGSVRRDYIPDPHDSDDASRDVYVWWEYAEIDAEETGTVQRYRFLRADSGEILLQDEWDDDWPYQSGTPIPKPHEFYGTSLAEQVMDIQLAKSTVVREWLDNIYGMNINRLKIYESVPGQVNMDDVLNQRVGHPIRIRSAPGGAADVQELQSNPIGPAIFPMLEFLDQVGEVRTGVSKFGQGLDPNVLHKTPATTAGFMMSLAQEKQALIARVYAETLVKDIGRSIYNLMRKYDNAERQIRLTNRFIPINPGSWPEDMDVTVNVGLGTGNKMQQAQNLQQLVGYMQVGQQMGIVSEMNAYHASETAVDVLGFVHPEKYFTNPETPEGTQLMQRAQQRAQQQDPVAQAMAQAALEKVQIEKQKVQLKNQIDTAKLQLEVFETQQKLGIDRTEVIEELRLKAQKLLQDAQLKLLEIQAETEMEGMELGVETALRREKMKIEERLGNKKLDVDTNVPDPDYT